jgi:Tfp pilus assembly protein PilO
MSAEVAPRSQSQYKQRVTSFLDSRRGKMFGVAEVVGLAGSCFVLLLVLLSYLYFLVPARSRVTSLKEDKARLEANLQTLRGVVVKGNDTKGQVDRIATSLTDFEGSYLLHPEAGRLQLYDELNQMILKNNLRNTSGPAYTPLDPTGTKSVGKTTTNKWQSFYPGVAVMVTVEGQYNDIRHFIRDLERTKQFVIINQVEIQRANENSNAPATAEEAAAGPRGSLVSLQINMTTYFQRETAATNNAHSQE